MKYLSLSLNAVLLIAVAVLFWLHFKGNKNSTQATKQINFGDKNMRIAFVDIARLDSSYKYITDKRKELGKNEDAIRNALSNDEHNLSLMQQKLQQDASDLENDTKISMADKYNRQKELQARGEKFQQDYANYSQRKEALEKKLNDDMTTFTNQMMDNLFANIKKYNTDQKYDYILAKQQMGGILAANDSLDITEDILTMLNDDYSKTGNR